MLNEHNPYMNMNIAQDGVRDMDLYVFGESLDILSACNEPLIDAHQRMHDQFIHTKPAIISFAESAKGDIGRIVNDVSIVHPTAFTVNDAFLINALAMELMTKALTFVEAIELFQSWLGAVSYTHLTLPTILLV